MWATLSQLVRRQKNWIFFGLVSVIAIICNWERLSSLKTDDPRVDFFVIFAADVLAAFAVYLFVEKRIEKARRIERAKIILPRFSRRLTGISDALLSWESYGNISSLSEANSDARILINNEDTESWIFERGDELLSQLVIIRDNYGNATSDNVGSSDANATILSASKSFRSLLAQFKKLGYLK